MKPIHEYIRTSSFHLTPRISLGYLPLVAGWQGFYSVAPIALRPSLLRSLPLGKERINYRLSTFRKPPLLVRFLRDILLLSSGFPAGYDLSLGPFV